MEIEIETVTPSKAETWLNRNKQNRRLRDGVVEKYASDMKAGLWTTCPTPISFYEDGDVADGQHRLWAIVESGRAQSFPVARGLQRGDGLNIDTGLNRTVIDNAKISGTDDGLTPAIISAAKAIEFGTVTIGRAVSNAEVVDVVKRHREAAAFASSVVRRRQGLCGSTILGAIGRAHEAGVDEATLRRFCDVLGSGLYDGEGETAAIALRNYFIQKGGMANASTVWRDSFLKAQNAISYFVRGKKLTAIKKVADEAYPLKKKVVRRG